MINLLTDEQWTALTRLKSFLSDSQPILVLQGQAGTGKTYLMNEFVKYLDTIKFDYVLCAPTHKAKLMLEKSTLSKAITLHNLLSLSPKIEIFKLNYKQLKFKVGDKQQIPFKGLVIVDESSMITDDLYKLLTETCANYNSKILFIGDKAQIQGVNEDHISKVFNCFNIITLNSLLRQNEKSGLIPLFNKLRVHSISEFSNIKSNDGNLYVYRNIKDFMLRYIEEVRIAMYKEDVTHTKLIAYTNSRVKGFNDCTRNLLWEDTNEYHKYEFLTGYENFTYKRNNTILNSLDYIIMDVPKYTSRNIPNYGKVPGYSVQLYDIIYKESLDLFILSKEFDDISSLANALENIRYSALETTNSNKKKFYWKQYYDSYNSFAVPYNMVWDNRVVKSKTIDYGYSSTVHKVQGSSLNNIFIDMDNIFKCRNEEELRQIQYVALSRTRSDVYLYY